MWIPQALLLTTAALYGLGALLLSNRRPQSFSTYAGAIALALLSARSILIFVTGHSHAGAAEFAIHFVLPAIASAGLVIFLAELPERP